MVEVTGVEKAWKTFQLNSVSFSLPKGYIMAVVGSNGAGKTTLLNLLLGVYQMDKGEIRMDGQEFSAHTVAIKNKLGFVVTDELFSGGFTLLENATYYGKYYEQYEEELFCQYLQRFELDPESRLKKLSKGEKLKFQFAFALAHKPKLLVLDEPTSNFDPEFRQEFLKILTEFVSDGEMSVILATHNMTDVEQIADYILCLNKGEQLFFKDREDLEQTYRMVEGPNYLVKNLDKELVVYREESRFGAKALVKHARWRQYDARLEVRVPGMEELLYGVLKSQGV